MDGSRGVLFGETPWGHRLSADRTVLVPDEPEKAVVAIVRHMKGNGRTLRQMVAELGALRVVGRRGRPIGLSRVFEIVHGARKRATPVAGGARARLLTSDWR